MEFNYCLFFFQTISIILKNLFPESLSGRKFLFILNPLSFKEYLYFNEKNEKSYYKFDIDNIQTNSTMLEYKECGSDYIDYIEFCGFPEVVVTKDISTKWLILKNIFASFFEKDIKILFDIKDITELRYLILLLVPRTSNILDVTKLSNELGVNRVKIYSFLELLQCVFFISLIPKYSKSINRTVAGGKKVYFSDTGLLNTIGKVTIGDNCMIGVGTTIFQGVKIVENTFIGAGSVVTKDVPDFALVVGKPAKVIGWWSEAGEKLNFDSGGFATCSRTGIKYKLEKDKVIEVK